MELKRELKQKGGFQSDDDQIRKILRQRTTSNADDEIEARQRHARPSSAPCSTCGSTACAFTTMTSCDDAATVRAISASLFWPSDETNSQGLSCLGVADPVFGKDTWRRTATSLTSSLVGVGAKRNSYVLRPPF
jgi:hypothetical protein